MKKYERKVCAPIKDKRPKEMKSVPVIGYTLMQAYEQRLRMVDDLIAEAVKELRAEKDDSAVEEEQNGRNNKS